jgi:hypothetical protein
LVNGHGQVSCNCSFIVSYRLVAGDVLLSWTIEVFILLFWTIYTAALSILVLVLSKSLYYISIYLYIVLYMSISIYMSWKYTGRPGGMIRVDQGRLIALIVAYS